MRCRSSSRRGARSADDSARSLQSVFGFAAGRVRFGSRGPAQYLRAKTTGGPMRASVTIIISALALVGTAPPLVAQTPPEPIVKVEGLRQISPHVHIIPDNSVPLVPNVG